MTWVSLLCCLSKRIEDFLYMCKKSKLIARFPYNTVLQEERNRNGNPFIVHIYTISLCIKPSLYRFYTLDIYIGHVASILLTHHIYSSGIQRLYNRHLTLLYPSFQLLFSAILNVYICVSFCLSCYYMFLLLCFHSHRRPDENNAFSAVQICKVSISQ